MSITLGQLASRYADAAQKVKPVSQEQVRTLGQVGVGYVKKEIQNVHAVDTGSMLNSTTMEQVGPYALLVGPTVTYAPYVALGTSRMPARPFHLRAAKRMQGAVNQGNLLRDLGL